MDSVRSYLGNLELQGVGRGRRLGCKHLEDCQESGSQVSAPELKAH